MPSKAMKYCTLVNFASTCYFNLVLFKISEAFEEKNQFLAIRQHIKVKISQNAILININVFILYCTSPIIRGIWW